MPGIRLLCHSSEILWPCMSRALLLAWISRLLCTCSCCILLALALGQPGVPGLYAAAQPWHAVVAHGHSISAGMICQAASYLGPLVSAAGCLLVCLLT